MKKLVETSYEYIASGLQGVFDQPKPYFLIEDPDGYNGYTALDKSFINASWPRMPQLMAKIEDNHILEMICMTAIETRQSNNFAVNPDLLDCIRIVADKNIKPAALKDALLNYKEMDWEVILICLQKNMFQYSAMDVCSTGITLAEEALLAKQWDVLNLLIPEKVDPSFINQYSELLEKLVLCINKDKQQISDKDHDKIAGLIKKISLQVKPASKIDKVINHGIAPDAHNLPGSPKVAKRIKIGPNISNNHFFLEKLGRVYSNHSWVNEVRLRILEGIPQEKITSLSALNDNDVSIVEVYDHKAVSFCVVQKSALEVPVFILPATSRNTANMDNEARANYMNDVFNQCYKNYLIHCQQNGKKPVAKEYCAATVVAGTKTMFGFDHFTAMVKPPGDNAWLHVDPTDFGGPQKFNRTQCGGYSSMIEAEALIHYSSKTLTEAKSDQEQNIVIRSFWQLIDTIAFKFNTWFAGSRNEVVLNSKNERVPRGDFETTYAEMADFSAGRLARKFNHSTFIDERMEENSLVI